MIIGLCGKKLVGKDTVGAYIRSNYGFKRKAFADLVKQSAAVAFNFKEAQLEDQDFKEEVDPRFGITPREALQKFGVGMRSLFGDDFWVRRLQLDQLAKQTLHNYVITDVRFPNELGAIRLNNGVLIKIERPQSINGNGSSHSSETALDSIPPEQYDYVINNTGDLSSLYEMIDKIMEQLGFFTEKD